MIQLLLGVGLFFSRSLILTGLLYGISIALLQLLTPFINALGMESINRVSSLTLDLHVEWVLLHMQSSAMSLELLQ